MIRYALRALRSHALRTPVASALTVIGVALGAGSVVAVHTLVDGAVAAFEGGVREMAPGLDLAIQADAGDFDERILLSVRRTPGVGWARPRLEGGARVAVGKRPFVRLLGLDLLDPTLPAGLFARREGSFHTDGAFLSPALARRLGLEPGGSLELIHGARRLSVPVGGIVEDLAPDVLLFDVAEFQERFRRIGRLDRIDVTLRPGADPQDVRRALARRLPAGVEARAPAEFVERARGLLDAFRFNLFALGFVSVVVGAFLVHAAGRAAVERRLRELGILRALGASRRQAVLAIGLDTFLLAALGALLGVGVGRGLALLALGDVRATLAELYAFQAPAGVAGPSGTATALAVGLAAALVGIVGPADRAARARPRALLRGELGGGGAIRPLLAALAVGAPIWTAALSGLLGVPDRWRGFADGFAWLAAAAAGAPLLLAAVGGRVRPRGLGLSAALRELGRLPPAVGQAAGALAAAAAVSFAVSAMVSAFRDTVDEWARGTMRADLYVTAPSWPRALADAGLEPEVLEAASGDPEVTAVERLRKRAVWTAGRRAFVIGVETVGGPERAARFPLVEGEPRALERFLAGEAALVSEPLARKLGLSVGGSIEPAPGVRLPVAGVFRDYTSELGVVALALERYEAIFGPGPPQSLGLHLAPGADPDAVRARLLERLSGFSLVVLRRDELLERVRRVFDRTFAVTRSLRAASLAVAACAVALALFVLVRERRREVALLFALGAGRAQVFTQFLLRATGLALVGLAAGGVGGAALFVLLTRVLNPAWFGWTIDGAASPRVLALEAGLIVAAAWLAAVVPALRAVRVPARELVRED